MLALAGWLTLGLRFRFSDHAPEQGDIVLAFD